MRYRWRVFDCGMHEDVMQLGAISYMSIDNAHVPGDHTGKISRSPRLYFNYVLEKPNRFTRHD